MYTVVLDSNKKDAFAPLLEPGLVDGLKEPGVVALGVIGDDNKAAGALLAWLRENWIDIGWFYVDPDFRGQDMGKLLLCKLMMAAKRIPGLSGVFIEYPDEPENQGLDHLFRLKGFRVTYDRKSIYTLPLESLGESPFWKGEHDFSRVTPLGQINDRQLKTFEVRLMEGNQPAAVELPIRRGDFHPDLSVAYVTEDRITGILLVQEGDGSLYLDYAHVLPESKTALGPMLRKAGEAALATYAPSTPIRIAVVTKTGEDIIERLFPSLEKAPICRAVFRFDGLS
jgi:GNAT superfamily N-acetyltransferase